MEQYIGSQEAVASLIELRSGVDSSTLLSHPPGHEPYSHRLENVLLTAESIRDLFRR